MERLPPGVGAVPERPRHGPVTSLHVGLKRLKQLGWMRGPGHGEMFRSSVMLLVLVPIGYIMAMAFLAAMFPKSESWLFMCLPVGLLLLLIYSSAYVYRTYRMMKDTEGMMMKLFTAPSDARLIEAVERAMGEAGFPYTRLTGSTASGVRERFLLVRHAVYRLPDLHASLMVSIGYDPDGQYPGKTLHLGPVNSDNFGGIVRLAEELDSIDIELAIQLGR